VSRRALVGLPSIKTVVMLAGPTSGAAVLSVFNDLDDRDGFDDDNDDDDDDDDDDEGCCRPGPTGHPLL